MSVIHFGPKDFGLVASALCDSRNEEFVIERIHRLSVSNAKAYFERYGINAAVWTIEEIKKTKKLSITLKERIKGHETLSDIIYNSSNDFKEEKIYLLNLSNRKLCERLVKAYKLDSESSN